jgi:hypothetical protein
MRMAEFMRRRRAKSAERFRWLAARRGVWQSRQEVKGSTKGLAVVVAACAGALALAAAAVAPNRAVAASRGGYGGLGATVSAFYAQNSQGSGMPPLGLVYYQVDATVHGRVAAFHIVINARPAFSARERVSQVGGVDLPEDATETNLNNDHCIVWHSQKLGRLIGMSYAAATTGADNTAAQMRAEAKPHC